MRLVAGVILCVIVCCCTGFLFSVFAGLGRKLLCVLWFCCVCFLVTTCVTVSFFFLCVAGFGFIMFDLDLGFVELRERI